ncbi:helix-turn-helix transcriptional regulator [Halococcus agarilyticus]|uniref:helix-turn-helix transcriptional regulator n=1 Tax=Halococcus agarilyticus TaxID=1232219 RepID=UPI000677C7A8|nr:helix-turn-helix domain-containing protein [Halococcus agarilyticus]
MSDRALAVAGVLCVLVLVGTGVPVGGQATPGGGVIDVTVAGGGVVTDTDTGNGSTYVWQDEPIDVSATFRDAREFTNYCVWLGYEREDASPQELVEKCDPKALSEGTNGTSEFTNVTWPSNVSGEQDLVVEVQGLSGEFNATLLDRETVPVTVITRSGDIDGDGLSNAREAENGYNLSNADMDGDGLNDGPEVNRYESNPQNPDTDGDGVRDGEEIEIGIDPSTADTDGDGLSDGTEVNLLRTDPDSRWTPVWLAGLVVLVGGTIVVGGTRFRGWWRERGDGAVAGSGGSSSQDEVEDVAVDGSEPAGGPERVDEPPEPLTDEDRVEALLREHGGRMKQSRIVEDTDWSKAKVSRLLSSMNDEGTVEKLSIGRENIVSLDGHGPEAARSPHEEPPQEENASD